MNNPISDKPVVKILIDLCHQHGVGQVIISPGSRNAPLILSFSGSGYFECLTIVDERSAGYFALGLAKATQKPVAVICTSGTAALNLAPAVAEAYYQQIPLVVLTADRPVEWINQADGQAISQQGIYTNFIRFQCQLPVTITTNDDEWYANRLINEALIKTTGKIPGPVHINVPLQEPLYGKTMYAEKPARKISHIGYNQIPSENELLMLIQEFDKLERVMILVGAFIPDEEFKKAISLFGAKGVLVLTETLSNLDNEMFPGNIDRVISTMSEDEYSLFSPDLLITLDVPVLSRMIKKLLRTSKPKAHWHFTNQDSVTDTYQSITRQIEGNASQIIKVIAPRVIQKKNNFVVEWEKQSESAFHKHKHYLGKINWCDLKLFDVLDRKSVV